MKTVKPDPTDKFFEKYKAHCRRCNQRTTVTEGPTDDSWTYDCCGYPLTVPLVYSMQYFRRSQAEKRGAR